MTTMSDEVVDLTPGRQGARWSSQETQQLLDGIRHGMDLDSLMAAHQRGAGAIRARVSHLLPAERRPASRTHALDALRELLDEEPNYDWTQAESGDQGRKATPATYEPRLPQARVHELRIVLAEEHRAGRLQPGAGYEDLDVDASVTEALAALRRAAAALDGIEGRP